MALILNIDTATEIAIVSIAENDKVLLSAINKNQKDNFLGGFVGLLIFIIAISSIIYFYFYL